MSSKRKKVATSAIAAVLVLALALAGTYAWSGGEDSDEEISGQIVPSVKLHDDFNKTLPGKTQTRDRKIYAENTGEASIYIRMKLNEYMSYAGKSIILGGEETVLSTWKTHVGNGVDYTDCGTGIHDYFELVMEGGKVEYNAGVKNRFAEDGTDNFNAAAKKESLEGSVVSMEDYMALTDAEKQGKYYWVVDTDGYAYWSQKLEPDTATAPFLNQIINTGIIDDIFYYGIQAKMEAVTERDLLCWISGSYSMDGKTQGIQATKNGGRLLKQISANYYEIKDDEKAKASEFDGDRDGFLTKSEYAAYLAKYPVSLTP